jgi:hypothetical protein
MEAATARGRGGGSGGGGGRMGRARDRGGIRTSTSNLRRTGLGARRRLTSGEEERS